MVYVLCAVLCTLHEQNKFIFEHSEHQRMNENGNNNKNAGNEKKQVECMENGLHIPAESSATTDSTLCSLCEHWTAASSWR